jgi:hypothetical protein
MVVLDRPRPLLRLRSGRSRSMADAYTLVVLAYHQRNFLDPSGYHGRDFECRSSHRRSVPAPSRRMVRG